MHTFIAFLRNHLGAAIAGVAAAVILAGGLLTLTLVGSGGSSAAAIVPSTTSTTIAPSAPPATTAKKPGVRGQITAINGSSWTLMSAKGKAVTVEVTATTAFGTKAAPLAASNFAVGDRVVVAGTATKGTVTAVRIAKAPAKAGAGGAGGTAPSTTTVP